MKDILLSIVVPTKNRYEYLKPFVELMASYKQGNVEMVIQDNSDDNTDFLAYLDEKKYGFVVYDYCAEPLSVVENSNRAVKASSGRYVCFMGDDDYVLADLAEFVKYMEFAGIESAFFNRAKYSWPNLSYSAHKIPNLVIPSFKGKVRRVSVERAYKRLLRKGAYSLDKAPQLYHGVILRACLDKIYEKTGTYFPGASPDMAVSVALMQVVKNHVYCDVPYVIAGTAPKSAGGLGAQHKHNGEIKNVPWLPKNTDRDWDMRVPKIWTGPTIYADSAVKAIAAMGGTEKLNYYYSYAAMLVFNKQYKGMVLDLLKGDTWGKIKTYFYVGNVFSYRAFVFAKNKLTYKFKLTSSTLIDDVPTSLAAGQLMNDIVNKQNFSVADIFSAYVVNNN